MAQSVFCHPQITWNKAKASFCLFLKKAVLHRRKSRTNRRDTGKNRGTKKKPQELMILQLTMNISENIFFVHGMKVGAGQDQ